MDNSKVKVTRRLLTRCPSSWQDQKFQKESKKEVKKRGCPAQLKHNLVQFQNTWNKEKISKISREE